MFWHEPSRSAVRPPSSSATAASRRKAPTNPTSSFRLWGGPPEPYRWSDQTFLSTGAIEPLFVASRQGRAYAVGTLREAGEPRNAFLTRAYDVSDGTLLWQNTRRPGDGLDSDHPTGIIASPTQVVIVGYGKNRAIRGFAVLLRAYDPVTGAVLWENRQRRHGFDLVAWTIAANRNRVFIAGTTATAALGQSLSSVEPDGG